jgi:hypothetical protein
MTSLVSCHFLQLDFQFRFTQFFGMFGMHPVILDILQFHFQIHLKHGFQTFRFAKLFGYSRRFAAQVNDDICQKRSMAELIFHLLSKHLTEFGA